MDVDAVEPTRNSPFINFFDVASNFPWQEPRPEQIRLRRAEMYNSLLFDDLLTAGGIDEPYLFYPPEDQRSLQRLLDTIEASNYDTLKKDCLIYFLLKWHQDGREKTFQVQRCIPPQFAALADAYWHIDTGINIPRAVALLSDSRLNRDYASKIIQALSIAPDGPALVRGYVQTAKPLLVEPQDINCYTLALADASILEAWKFSRTFNETDEMRSRLFKTIIEWTVTPHPRPVALTQLIVLPLSPFEESVLNRFVEEPRKTMDFSAIAILQDLICVRLIQGGRYNEAIKLDRQFASKTLPKDLNATKARSNMVHEVYTALPSIERSLIDSELDPMVTQKSPLVPKPASPVRRQPGVQESENLSLSQSWEDVQMPEALVKNKSTPLKDVRIPSSTPRFGAAPLQALTSTPKPAPIIPINFNGGGSGSSSTPKKNISLSASVIGSAKPRASMSGVGSRMVFGDSSIISSPASGMKIPAVNASSSHGPGHAFVSAGRQQNAFYQPPPDKTNGVKRTFEEVTTDSPERGNASGYTMDVEMESEKEYIAEKTKEKGKSNGKQNGTRKEVEEEDVLQYSLFRSGNEPSAPSQTAPKASSTKATQKKKAPPGSFMSDDEDDMDDDHDDHDTRKTSRARTTKSTRANKEPAAPTKPLAKKARQTKEKDLSRSIPGGLMDDEHEEEEEDEVAPLRAPSPPRRGVRKSRSSASVDPVEENEGPQTRRRSSRLTTGGSGSNHGSSVHGGSVHGGSPEPQSAPKAARKATRTSGGAKKKR